MLIVYSAEYEVIVTTKENEKQTIKDYFTEGGRDLDSYDREEIKAGAVSIDARVKLDW
jgi:hypothetical protein